MNRNVNPTYPIRSGFDYQDLWVLKLFGKWLLAPEEYKEIRIEYNPTEEGFYLDDIVCTNSTDQYLLYQIKYKVDINYCWTWNDLLAKKKNKKNEDLPCLINKWNNSIRSLGYDKIAEASFVTNSKFDHEIQDCIDGNKIDIKLLKKQVEIYDLLVEEFSDEIEMANFFNLMNFVCENNDVDTFEKEIISDIYFEKLYVTYNGVSKVQSKIRQDSRSKYTSTFTIQDLRELCEFDIPKPLNESFNIPLDFQFFNISEHKSIVNKLKNKAGGTMIVYGKPGTGKSVYLSKLSNELVDSGIVVIKHHYHIDTIEHNFRERVDSRRVIEAIKAQFKVSILDEYIGDLKLKNSREIPLIDFIKRVAQNSYAKNKSFVFILDGLDHVIRERDLNELKKFLNEIFFPQEGFWLLMGAQPQVILEPQLSSIFSTCDEMNKIEIKGIDDNSISRIIDKNLIELIWPLNKKEIVNKIVKITQGNPLHLRYVLSELKNRTLYGTVSIKSLDSIFPYGGNIETYYKSLWRTLEHEIKAFVLVFVNVDFQFSYEQFVKCISSFSPRVANISEAFMKIDHLIDTDDKEKIRIYHDSFKVFLLNQKEYIDQKILIKKNIKGWLESSTYENLKWENLKILEVDLGNDLPILEIDRKWLIDAISTPRNSYIITKQLKTAIEVAQKHNNYSKMFELSNLLLYYENAKEYYDDIYPIIYINSLKLNSKAIDDLYLKNLPIEVLMYLMENSEKSGNKEMLINCLDVLIEKQKYVEDSFNSINPIAKALSSVIPFDRNRDVLRMYKYIIQFRKRGSSVQLFDSYSKRLIELEQNSKLKELLKFDLLVKEREIINYNCIASDFENRDSKHVSLIVKKKDYSIFEKIYLIFNGQNHKSIPLLPMLESYPQTIKEYGEETSQWAQEFYNNFFTGILYSLSDNEDIVNQWISSKQNLINWPCQVTLKIFQSGLIIGNRIKTQSKINFCDLFLQLNQIEDLSWEFNRDKYPFKSSLRMAIKNILKNLMLLKSYLNDNTLICKADFKIITSTHFFRVLDLFEFASELDKKIFDNETAELISIAIEDELSLQIETFRERSLKLAQLNKFYLLYDNRIKAIESHIRSIDNLLGYGDHKDIFLYEILEAITACYNNGVSREIIHDWIYRLIPIINIIAECTDGDETSHLEDKLSEFLIPFDQSLLYKLYYFLADGEELFSAQDKFKDIIESLDYKDITQKYLASTALDKNSFVTLENKSFSDNDAKESKKIIEDYLGRINYRSTTTVTQDESKTDEDDYSLLNISQLEEYLKELDDQWKVNKYLVDWTKYWLPQKSSNEFYNQLIGIISNLYPDKKKIPGDLLDSIYPVSYEHENESTFSYICLAQINDHGWNRYWNDIQKAKRRWKFIKDKYPGRSFEFFNNTIENNIPLSRGVEYFVYFNENESATKLTEAGVSFCENLMADILLKMPEWAKDDYRNVDEVDIIIQRLVWPSQIIRERAANALGNLINDEKIGKTTYMKLLEWISNWELESIIAIGLLPIIRAYEVSKDRSLLDYISVNDIIKNINASSEVINSILREISIYSIEDIIVFPNELEIVSCPKEYKNSEFFEKYIIGILSPIYSDRAEEIENEYNIPFKKLWSYNADLEFEKNGIIKQSNKYFYGTSRSSQQLSTAFSTKVSEVYRSVYVRLLFSIKDKMERGHYLMFLLSTCPIDFSLWRIHPNEIPNYWPALSESINKIDKKSLSLIKFKKTIKSLIEISPRGYCILGAEGAVVPSDGWLENPDYEFTLIGFGYKVNGSSLPSAEKVAKELIYGPVTTIPILETEHSLCFHDSNRLIDIDCEPYAIDDLDIYPLISRNIYNTTNYWQYFRNKIGPFNAVYGLRKDLSIYNSQSEWGFRNNDNEDIIVFQDWICGLKERYKPEMPWPYGKQMLVNKDYIESLLKKSNLRLGYIVKKTYCINKHQYDDVEKYDEYGFINVSQIIMPTLQ